MLIYIFIFLYGVQIMQGVIEEKTNRIVEVIVSSVKPFQLMMGKILGIAMVGLTQFAIWIILSLVLGGAVAGTVMSKIKAPQVQEQALKDAGIPATDNLAANILHDLASFDYAYLVAVFLFYFIGGYLFYGALFAAVGSAIDNETDKQQFMVPITLPLIFALILAQSAVISNPHGPVAFWLSMIPLTSPIVMMVRVPFQVPGWQLAVSMLSMIGGFLFTVWLAARIYRIGILMYGKKASYKELAKWLFIKG
jgi:ABC-2 type transport system permease protein